MEEKEEIEQQIQTSVNVTPVLGQEAEEASDHNLEDSIVTANKKENQEDINLPPSTKTIEYISELENKTDDISQGI